MEAVLLKRCLGKRKPIRNRHEIVQGAEKKLKKEYAKETLNQGAGKYSVKRNQFRKGKVLCTVCR
jgi:hypothetical protein